MKRKLIFLSLIGLIFSGCTFAKFNDKENFTVIGSGRINGGGCWAEVYRTNTMNLTFYSDTSYPIGTNLKIVAK